MAARPANDRPIVIVRKIKRVGGGHHGGAWKVAYADFVTAMMAFFMLLWLISSPDKARLKGLAEYFTPSSGGPEGGAGGASGSGSGASAGARPAHGGDTPNTVAVVARGGTAAIPDASLRVLAQEMRIAIDTLPPAERARIATRFEPDRDGLRISLMDTAGHSMFRPGTAELNDFARTMLARVAGKLATSAAPIAIEGHTDASGGEGNWRLSGERALAARTTMIAAGLPAGRFAEMVAMADTRPVYPDQPDRPENRRITIVAKASASALPTDSSFRF
ncbi:flagellar motor protein MotB [Sphingomonas sp. CFBP9019]|uniref:flagellar motor protein MotB n=1 Tax=Sphingomonas sp. CFBP9019 TaxID=3096532 RepID=UPI002A6A9F62|nr:flagellar motor protein MotB [Sphingomonas sp. CFBP9019]MDY1009939.1 flagellar motor protein MotB [Sphingomonas sp. CFBP9019]